MQKKAKKLHQKKIFLKSGWFNDYLCPYFVNRMSIICRFTTLFMCSFALFACGLSSKTKIREGVEEFYYMEGLSGFHQGHYAYAADCFKRVLKLNPHNDAALYYIGNIRFLHGDMPQALDYMKAAAQVDTSNYWYRTQIAQLYMKDQKIDAAIEVYEDLVDRYPRKMDLYYDLANLYLNHREADKALALLDRIERIGSASEATGFYRYHVLMMQEKEEEALQWVEQMADVYASPRAFAILGDFYAESGQDSLALAYYQQAIDADPDCMPAIFGQAEIYRMKRQFDLFFQNMYLIMDHSDVDASMKKDYMGQLIQNRSFVTTFLPQVDSLFAKMYYCHPQDTSVVYFYAGFLVQAGKDGDAVEILEQNAVRYPQNQMAWSQYLSIHYFLQNWDELYTLAREVKQRFPKDPHFVTMEGLAAWQLDRILEAILLFESVLPMAKGNSELLAQTYSILGDLYHATHDADKSFKAYEQSLKIDPNQIGALNNYAYFLALAGKNLQKAYEMSKKTIDAEPQNPTYLDTFGWILYLLDRPQEAKAIFRQVLVYGGTEQSAEVLDHYAEVLFALKEYDMAFIYWEQAKSKEKNPELEQKIALRKTQMKP